MADIKREKKDNIEQSIVDSISKTDLTDLSLEIGETILDSILEEGILKDIPVFSIFWNLAKTGISIKDKLFAKKIYKFLTELQNISQIERENFISEVEESQDYEAKVGETLLLIIDKCDDMKKSSIMGKLFSAAIQRQISYIEFLKLSSIVNRAFLPTLSALKHDSEISRNDFEELFSLSLVTLKLENDLGSYERRSLSDHATRKGFSELSNKKPEPFNQKIRYQLSENGFLLKNILFL